MENEDPELILVHFDYASRADLRKYQAILGDVYPESSILLPDRNSDEELLSENIRGIVRAAVLGLIAFITIVQLMGQWIGFYRKELAVYHIAGMTRLRCSLLLGGHWTVFFIIASGLAVATHYACLSFLDLVEADYMPAVLPLLIVLGVIYITTILYSVKFVSRVLGIRGGGEAI